MFDNPWCKSYWQHLVENKLIDQSGCGCPNPKNMPLTDFVDESVDKLVDEDGWLSVIENNLNKVFAYASKNVYSEGPIDEASINDLFKSLEQPPYDAVVHCLVIPMQFKQQVLPILKKCGDRQNGKMYLWTADVIFVESEENKLVITAKNRLAPHSMIVAKEYKTVKLKENPDYVLKQMEEIK